MGTCVSTHQKPSAMKVQVLFGANDINIVKPPIINGDLAVKPQRPPAASFRDFGSKEETFFDSQAWLESDCDDDFMSVNGDFTPSRGNTPVHHKFSNGSNKPAAVSDSPYQPSPNGSEKKMRLSDLFKDSLRETYEFEKEEDGEKKGKKVESPIVHAGGNGLKTKRMQGCFPSLLYTRSSSRKMMSPNPNPNPNPNPVVG